MSNTLVIIDDDVHEVDMAKEAAVEAGYDPVVVPPDLGNLAAVVDAVEAAQPAGVICDQRLSHHSHASFEGAAAVAELTERGIPSILVSQYLDDAEIAIRPFLPHVPVLLRRDDLQAEQIADALELCRDEIEGHPRPDRVPYRVLVDIRRKERSGGIDVAVAVVPARSSVREVRFPLSLIPESLLRKPVDGQVLIAWVNIGTESEAELFFDRFEAAPPPAELDDVEQV
jgi:hypothetical protein